MPTEKTIVMTLNFDQAMALAQFVKRLSWSEMRGCAVDDDEAYEIRSALEVVQKELAQAGFNPR